MLHHYLQRGHRLEDLIRLNRLEKLFYIGSKQIQEESDSAGL